MERPSLRDAQPLTISSKQSVGGGVCVGGPIVGPLPPAPGPPPLPPHQPTNPPPSKLPPRQTTAALKTLQFGDRYVTQSTDLKVPPNNDAKPTAASAADSESASTVTSAADEPTAKPARAVSRNTVPS